MSLLTQFNEVKSKIENANYICDSMWGSTRYKGYNENYWRLLRFNGSTYSATYTPTLNDFVGLEADSATYYADGYTSQFNVGNNYLGMVECYVHCTEAASLSVIAKNDDYGAIYINGVLQFNISVCGQNKTGTLNFKPGWNYIQYIFNEVNGDDYAYINTSLHTQSFIDKMYASLEVIEYGE